MAKTRASPRSTKSSKESSRDFYFTASQLIAFYQCPAKYAFSRAMASRLPPSPWLRDGNDAHRIMAGKGQEVQKASRRASKLAQRAWRFMQKNYGPIRGTEISQSLRVSSGFVLLRTLDALAEDSKGSVIIDYKFTGQQWDIIQELDLAPRAAGFQAKCYLISPDDITDWPTRIHFVVVDDDGIERYEYSTHDGDFDEVLNAAKLMKHAWDNKLMPKNRGYLCHTYCDFRQPCFDEKDWRDDFDERDNDPYSRDVRYRDEGDL